MNDPSSPDTLLVFGFVVLALLLAYAGWGLVAAVRRGKGRNEIAGRVLQLGAIGLFLYRFGVELWVGRMAVTAASGYAAAVLMLLGLVLRSLKPGSARQR